MLPSSGLFTDIVCPYYKQSTCQRPHCHFRHSKNVNIIEQLDDIVIKEALLSKQYHNALQQSINKELPIIIKGPSNSRDSEKIQDCRYKPTPISKLKTEQSTSKEVCGKSKSYCPTITAKNEAPIYIPSSIADKAKLINPNESQSNVDDSLLSHYIPALCNGKKDEEEIIYKPSSNKSKHKDENAYEPHGISAIPHDAKSVNNELIHYKPSSSSSVNQNTNTYEPQTETNKKSDILDYKPSSSSKIHKHNNFYEPHGISDNTAEYLPSLTIPSKRTSPNILNEISNLSDDKQPCNKKSKIDIDLDNFQNEFDLIDEILCASNDSQDGLVKDRKTKNNSNPDKTNSAKKGISTNSKSNVSAKSSKSSSKKSSSSNHISKHASSSHRSSSSQRSKNESESSVKNSKERNKSKIKTSDKKNSHQSKSAHDSKHKSPIKHSSDSEKSKNRKKHDLTSTHSKKPHKEKDYSENTTKKAHSINLNSVEEDNYLFSEDETELDRPACSTDLKDPIVLECLKISEEYNNSLEHLKAPVVERQTKTTINEIPVVPNNIAKKRIAHSAAVTISRPTKQVKKFTPATIFVERYKKIMDAQRLEEMQDCEKKMEEINSGTATYVIPNRIKSFTTLKSNIANDLNNRPTLSKPIQTRVAHVPKNIANTPSPVQTLKKGSVRKAHVPNQNVLKKIDASNLLDLNNCRIPSNVRLSYLNYITEACLEMHKNDVESAYKMAREEELCVAKKCMNIKVYKNSCLASILKIRKATKVSESQGPNDVIKRCPETVMKYENLTTSQKYMLIKKWILTDEELSNNSFPMPTDVKGVAKVLNDSKKFIEEHSKTRQCARCPKQYTVDDDGIPLVREACIYHPKRCYTTRGRSTYRCCGAGRGSGGCSSGDHVIEGIIGPDKNLRTGFVQTLQKPHGHPANESIYAVDCEMVYTTKGIELARVTVVNDALETVYDTFVKPANYILDYATIFSGITSKMLEDVTTTIFHVQAVLLNMFSDKTILVGHSLESDLKALKLVHKSIVDTSILFPHKAGPPMKRALKTLATEYLQKIIQESHCGHDSAEDARVSMELVIWKLRDSLKI